MKITFKNNRYVAEHITNNGRLTLSVPERAGRLHLIKYMLNLDEDGFYAGEEERQANYLTDAKLGLI